MTIEAGVWVTVGLSTIAFIVWLVRLEGRQNTHERECMQYRKLLDERHLSMKDTLGHMDEKLDRLVERVS